jgi:hypothetical protein
MKLLGLWFRQIINACKLLFYAVPSLQLTALEKFFFIRITQKETSMLARKEWQLKQQCSDCQVLMKMDRHLVIETNVKVQPVSYQQHELEITTTQLQ